MRDIKKIVQQRTEAMSRREEARAKRVDAFNDFQKDMRGRVDGFCKSVTVLSGGLLTVSIGVFLRKDRPSMTPDLTSHLITAWVSLFVSLLTPAFVTLTAILGGYLFAEKWRKLVTGKTIAEPGEDIRQPLIWLQWGLAAMAIAALVTGVSSLAYVACRLIQQ